MKKTYSDEQIVGFVREAEKTEVTIAEFCRQKGFNEGTFYKWKKRFWSMQVAEIKRLAPTSHRIANLTAKKVVFGRATDKLGRNDFRCLITRRHFTLNRFCSSALCAIKKMTAAVKGRPLAAAAFVAAFSAIAVAAVLTPGIGILSAPILARASFADPTNVAFTVNGRQVNVTNAKETVIQQIVIGPGGHTGWHSHPGPVVVLIKQGQMSFYDGEVRPAQFAPIRLVNPLLTEVKDTFTSPATKAPAKDLSYGQPTSTCHPAGHSGLMLRIREIAVFRCGSVGCLDWLCVAVSTAAERKSGITND